MMDHKNKSILVVDENQLNLDAIEEYLFDVDVNTICVGSGEQALEMLKQYTNQFGAVLLDPITPGIDGIEFLSSMKADENLSHIPVIIQSDNCSNQYISEVLNAGALYYLAKPLDKNTLVDVLLTAIRDFKYCTSNQDNESIIAQSLEMMDKGVFCFRSLNEGRKLAAVLAKACPNSDIVVLGLTELFINAVEHGNLGIGYDEKSKLNEMNNWENEVKRRLSLPQNKNKKVSIEFCRNKNEITFLIIDQGVGFDWSRYMQVSPERITDNHGRGIAMANMISFDQIKYLEAGNKVCVKVSL